MNLINQVIEKKLAKADEDRLNNVDNEWDTYQASNFAGVLSESKINHSINKLWKKVILE